MERMLQMVKHGWQLVLAVLLPFMKSVPRILFGVGKTAWEMIMRSLENLRVVCREMKESLKSCKRNWTGKRIYSRRRPVHRLVAGILAMCLVVTLMPVTAFARTQVDQLPEPTVPSENLYLRISWQTTKKVGIAANKANCEASYLDINLDSSVQYHYLKNEDSFHFNRDILNDTSIIPIAEYTWDQGKNELPMEFYLASRLGDTRSFSGNVIFELKDLTTGEWHRIATMNTGTIKGTTIINHWNDISQVVGFYDDLIYIKDGKEFVCENHVTHIPKIKGDILMTTTKKVEPSASISTYFLMGSPTLMTTTGYTWESSDFVTRYGVTWLRMGTVTFKNPRIVAEDGATSTTISGISVEQSGSQSFKLNVGSAASQANGQKFCVAFDVYSEKYGTSTTAHTNVIEVQVPAENTPAAPTLVDNTAKTITINTVSGQKYMMTDSSTAPATSASGWENGTTGTKKYSNLTPGKTYYFWTYKPAGSGTTASNVSKALVVKTTDPISTVALTVPEPTAGNAIPKKSEFSVSSDDVYVTNSSWKYKDTDGTYRPDNITFSYGLAYRVEAELEINGMIDNMFADTVTATVNGKAATVTRNSDTTIKVISEDFPETSEKMGLNYKINKDGAEWTASAPFLTLRKDNVSQNLKQLPVGDYEIYIKMPGGTAQPIGQTLSVIAGVQPELTLDYWTVTFHDAEDKALTQGYNLVQTVLAGRSPVAPTGTTLTPPKAGQILTWMTKDSDDNGNIEETPFVIGTDTIYEVTDLYARWVDPITSVAVADISTPQGGAKPDTEATVPEGAPYAFSDLKWSPEVNGTFDYNTEYTATVSLLAKKGQGFSDSLTATVNGETASVTKAEGAAATIMYKFAPTGADPAPAVAAAKTTVKDHTFTVAQATANTETAVKAWLVTEINNLLTDAGVTTKADDITISNNSFQAAVAGTASSTSGTNGEFKFTAKLTKGSASDTTEEIKGSITATAYVGQDTTVAPAFTTSGTSYTKTSNTDSSAIFTLTKAAESGTSYYVYTDQAGKNAAQATVTTNGTELTVSGDAIAGITAKTDLYITAQESGKKESSPAHVVVYPVGIQQTAAPVFEAGQDTYAKITEDINTASFVMKENYPEGTAYKVYESASSETVMDGVTASGTGTGLTLTGISGLTESTTYYISATEPEKTESQRVSVTVTPYVAPSVTLGTDSLVRSEYKDGVATTDKIELKYNPGSNPDTEFTVDDFKIMKQYGSTEPAQYLTIVSINVEQNTMTIASTRPASGAIYAGYLYYKDTPVGSITDERYYATISTNAQLSALTLSEGTLNPAFDPSTTAFTATVSNSVDKIKITPVTQNENATVKINNVAVEKGKGSEVELKVGENLIEVDVTAQDKKTTHKYLLTVTREAPEGDAPAFVTPGGNTYTKTSANDQTASFTLTQEAEAGTTYKVYAQETGGTPLKMTAAATGTTLTLKDISAVTEETSYYISATAPDKAESGRTKVTVKPYLAPTAAPTFEVVKKMLGQDETSVVFKLTNDAEGRTYHIYKTATGETPMPENNTNPSYAFENGNLTFTYTALPEAEVTYYVAAVEENKPESNRIAISVQPYVAQGVSTAPSFSVASYGKVSSDDEHAEFTLTSTPVGTTTFKVYDQKADGNSVDVKVSVNNKTMTLTGDAIKNLTEKTTWYVAATEKGKNESTRIAVTINPYAAPSAELGSDKTVSVSFPKEAEDTAVKTDTVDVTMIAGTNPEHEFSANEFSLSDSSTAKNPITDLTVTEVDTEKNKVTIQVKKKVTAEKAYLWYLDQLVGELTITNSIADQSIAPDFNSTEAAFVSDEADTVTFTLKTAPEKTTYKVYDSEEEGTALTDPAVTVKGTTLTLTFTELPESKTQYYISATKEEESESSRTAVTVKPYSPVTLGDKNSDKTVEVTFLTTDADTVTKNDTIDVVFHKGTNPDYTFEKEDFSFLNGDNKKTDREVIDDLTVTNVDEENGTLTVTMAKSVAPTDNKAYLWYRYNDTTDYYVGEITIDKTVNTPSIPPDTKTKAPAFESATAAFASDAANSVTYTLKSVPENTTYQLYGEQEGGDALSAPTMALDTDKKTLTLTFASKPAEDTVYYLTATEQGKEESSRVAITVRKYAAPSAALGDDSTVAVKFQSSDAGTVTDTDTIKVVLNKGTNPDYSFTSDLFSLSSSNSEKKTIDNLSITELNAEEGTITVQMAKSVTAETAYLWYGDQSIGQITISKTVETPQSSEKQITGFTIPNQAEDTEINQTAHTIKVTMPAGTAVTNLTPAITVSTGAAISPQSGAEQDFSSPVTYTVTAEDGSTQDYTVTVEVESQTANIISEVNVTGITAPVAGETPDTTADNGEHWSAGTVSWTPNDTKFGYSTEYTASVTITAAEEYQFAALDNLSATVGGETAEVTRTSDTSITVSYQYEATAEEGKSSAKQITGFTIADQIGDTRINQTNHTIKVTMPAETDLTSLEPAITISDKATVNPESGAAQNFSSPVTYTVTAEDGSTQAYIVTVEAESQSNTISEVDVTGITAPVAGETPDTSAKDGTHWSAGAVSWNPNHTTFAYETQYTASVTITAAEGYQFAEEGALAATVDGEDAEVTRTSDTAITVSYEFSATDAEGDTYTVTYKLTNLTANEQPEQVEKDGELEATLTAEEGYELPDTITVKMGSQTLTAGSDYTYDSESGTVKITAVTGNVVITAEGVSDGTFIAVTDITGVPEYAEVGKALKLKGTVKPSNATNQKIQWEVTDDGETGAEIDEENNLTASASGEITVTATITDGTADGEDYTQEFTIKVAGVASSSDAEYVEKASDAIQKGKYSVKQSTAENQDSFLSELVNLFNKILDKLFGEGKTEPIETSDITIDEVTDAVEGDEENRDGEDGEFTFSVEIHKGDESNTVEGLTGTIKATPFTDEDQKEKDEEAVYEAIDAIEEAMSDIKVSQKNAKTEAKLKDTLKERAKKKAGKATVNDIQFVGSVTLATEGTYEEPDGTEGSFTFKVCVSKGSVQDIWTDELEGTITPTEYVLQKPEITTSSLPDGTIGEDYEVTLKAKSDTEVTWSISDGELPEGIRLDGDTISGTPTEAGNFSVVISADNGSDQGTTEKTYTITISAGTEGTEHTITASAGTGGTISPSGTVTVADGGNQTFTITATKNYYLSDVLVDNVSVGSQASYTFSRVSSDHTIEAVFTRGSLGPGTGSGSGGSGSSGSSSSTTQTAPPSTTTNVTATADGGSMTTTQTTTTDSSGKKTTVSHEVQKDAAGNVTGSTTTVTTDRVTTATDQGKTTVTVNPEASAINNAAGAAGATNQNPLEVLVTVPQTVIGEIQKAEVNAVTVNVVIPKAAADNQAVEVAGAAIGKDVIQAARESGKNLEVTIKDEAGNLEAVWSLNGQAMKNVAGEPTDLSLGAHAAALQSSDPAVAAVREAVTARGAENGLMLNITGTGTLLAPAKLTVPATGQTGFTPGTTVALYRYDEATKALTAVPGGMYTVDGNGNVTVDIPAGTRTGVNEIYVLLAGPVQGAGGTYSIQKGDTLNKISRQYGCSVQELLALNPGLDIYNLQVGQNLNVPGKVQ